jgi:IS4 transposase
LSGAASLREIEAGLQSHTGQLYHLGVDPARRSTLSDANALRPSAVFAGLFAEMVKRAHRGLRRKVGEATYLIDSTRVRLNSLSNRWARFTDRVCGAKVHVTYDPDADRPTFFSISAANVNDITEAKAMPIEGGATYVFDLGYYDFAWWAQLADAGCRIVTRFKKYTNLSVVKELALPKNSDILSDRIGYLSERMARNRKNPFQDPVREVRVKTETGKVLRILTNDINASAQEIADLYKRRWAIELFFRWVKQTLKITRFLGTSENAVRIQIAVALITFLLLRMAQDAQNIVRSPLAFARLIRANLMHRRRIDHLLKLDPKPVTNTDQLVIQWT